MHDEWVAGDRRYLSEGSMGKLYETSNTEAVAAIESSDVKAPRITSKPTTPRGSASLMRP
jgi:hypothetical protein